MLGSDVIAQVAQKAVLGHADVSSALAAVLPSLIDRLTPNGHVPTRARSWARSVACPAPGSLTRSDASNQKVDLNTASKKDLEALPQGDVG